MKNKGSKRTAILLRALVTAVLLSAVAFAVVSCVRQTDNVVICGEEYGRNITEINLKGVRLGDDFSGLLQFTDLKYADLTDTGITAEQYETLCASLPECDVVWSVPVGNEYYPCGVEEFTLKSSVSPSDIQNVKYFTRLRDFDASAYPLCDELYDAVAYLKSERKDVSCKLSGTLYGVTVTDETVSLDLSKKKITDLSEFYQKLKFFTGIKEIFLGNVRTTDEETDRLNKAFPDTDIIWLVEFARWQVRTDIKVFSTQIGYLQQKTFDTKQLYPLLAYCTELRALDLGHNRMSDIGLLDGLRKLEVLIISGNPIDSIEPLKNLSELRYLEMFNCEGVDDLSPLAGCSNLEDLMINNMGQVRNADVLAGCRNLRLLYAKMAYPVDYSWKELQKALPDCAIDTTTYHTKGVWRNSDMNGRIRTAFGNWSKIQTYNRWDDYVIGSNSVGWQIK